jgi:predicted nucleotidyltransferase
MTDEPQKNLSRKRFRAALNEMYGDRLERVVLYGSQARGNAHEESNYDVAVFLRDMPDRIAELYRLADLSTKIIVEKDGPLIHTIAYPAGFSAPRASTCEGAEQTLLISAPRSRPGGAGDRHMPGRLVRASKGIRGQAVLAPGQVLHAGGAVSRLRPEGDHAGASAGAAAGRMLAADPERLRARFDFMAKYGIRGGLSVADRPKAARSP